MQSLLFVALLGWLTVQGAELPTASNSFAFALSPPVAPGALLAESPFGINNALRPDAPDLLPRLQAMRQAGIKWGRQDFTWRRIELSKGEYDWAGYDALVEKCHEHGLLIFGNLTYNKQRTGANPFPFGESPIYIVGPKGLKVNLRPDPGW
jgi:hypothetical protein